MFRVTYIAVTDDGLKLVTVSHPHFNVIDTLHDALRLAGKRNVRRWSRDGRLVK